MKLLVRIYLEATRAGHLMREVLDIRPVGGSTAATVHALLSLL